MSLSYGIHGGDNMNYDVAAARQLSRITAPEQVRMLVIVMGE
ncbi:MAG: hypothetical protein ACKOU6_05660 [Planctomycetota bacterium]